MKTSFILFILSFSFIGCNVEQEATKFNQMEFSQEANEDNKGGSIDQCAQEVDMISCQAKAECQALLDESEKFLSCFKSPVAVTIPKEKEEEGGEYEKTTETNYATDSTCGKNNKKVIVCHVPPGNPEKIHSLCISKSAWENAHSQQHSHAGVSDHLGACTLREVEVLI